MRVHIVTGLTVVPSFIASVTPRIETVPAVELDTVAVSPDTKPHVVQHEVGVRVRTLGLLCNNDVMEGLSAPVASNLREVVNVAVKIVPLPPVSLESNDP